MLGTIGLATETPAGGHAWAPIIRRHGYRVVPMTVRGPLPEVRLDLVVVVLDPRTAPTRLILWLRQLVARIVLVTPQLPCAQSLAGVVPSLCIACDPLQARTGLADVLALAQTISRGLLTLPAPSQVYPCSP
jgi:hypothetical protein